MVEQGQPPKAAGLRPALAGCGASGWRPRQGKRSAHRWAGRKGDQSARACRAKACERPSL